MEWRPARWSMCLPLLIFPCTIKSRTSLLPPAHPGWSRKKGRKTAVVVCGLFAVPYGKDRCLEEIHLEQLLVSNVAAIVQENSKDPGDIGKLVFNPRAPSKKTKSKQPPLGTAQLNDKNKSELTTVTQSQQMALLQRQSAGACDDTRCSTESSSISFLACTARSVYRHTQTSASTVGGSEPGRLLRSV